MAGIEEGRRGGELESLDHGKIITFPAEQRQVAIEKELLAPLVEGHLVDAEWTHENLVQAFRSRIKEQQEEDAKVSWIGKTYHQGDFFPPALPPEKALRSVMDWYAASPNEQRAERFHTLRRAWDALAYEQYEPGSREEGLAGSELQAYYGATHEPTITLSPLQTQITDAMAEAAGIPHKKGQTAIEIPEKLRHYNRYLLSPEYQERLSQAQAKKQR
jgi:hypothetical protein